MSFQSRCKQLDDQFWEEFERQICGIDVVDDVSDTIQMNHIGSDDECVKCGEALPSGVVYSVSVERQEIDNRTGGR